MLMMGLVFLDVEVVCLGWDFFKVKEKLLCDIDIYV